MITEVFDWLLRSTFALSLAIVVVMALRPVWRRWLGAGSVLWLWLLLPAALLATSLPRPTVVVEQDGSAQAVAPVSAAQVPAHTGSFVVTAPDDTAAAWRSGLPWVSAWIAGVLLLAGRLAWQQRAFRHRLGSLQRRHDGSYSASTTNIGPAVVGALRPRIVVPADFEQRYDPQQRALVLAHERVHLRRGDLQVNLGLCALRCTFWFNPLVHLAASRLRLDQELACDAAVLRTHPDAGRAYATALLNTQLADLGLPVGCYWQSSHPLMWRIAMLKHPSPGSVRLLLGAGFALFASSAAAVSLWQLQPMQTVALPAAATPARHVPELASERLAIETSLPAVRLGPVPAQAVETVAVASPVATAAVAVAGREVVRTSAATTAEPVAATTPAEAASELIAPRVSELWLADLPTGRHGRDRKRERTGAVVVELTVSAEGKPGAASIAHSELGQRYQANALAAVQRWKFEPARRGGVAVASTVLVTVPFDLGQDPDGYWVDGVEMPQVGWAMANARPTGR